MTSAVERTLLGALQLASSTGNATISAAKQLSRAARRRSNSTRLGYSSGRRFIRTSSFGVATLVAGEASGYVDPTLNQVQTSDLIGMFDMYRIRQVRFRLIPAADPGQSGVVNNGDAWVAVACDPIGQYTAPTWTQVTAFENSKVLPLLTGKELTYVFRPKAINALSAGNLAVNQSDWLILNASGAAIPHQRLYYDIKSSIGSSTASYTFVLEFDIEVRQSS